MPKFIYVFDEESKSRLLEAHFQLLKKDDKNKIYIFVNEVRENFALHDFRYALSDTLMF